ncbi:MAG TPA: beta-galactosidase trimerization domain-containing protein [Bryobacteraceae bacterium]|jgi:hypothetical protein
MNHSRRDFVRHAAGLAVALHGSSKGAAAASSSDGWYDRPMRWAQVAFVEDDPGNYDLQFWLDYFKRCHIDAACLSAGGCVAFYPTQVPLHYKSKFMRAGTDPFGDFVGGCRKLGMNVIARTDPHAAHQDVYDQHPDWIAVDASGKPRRHWADPELWVTCALGPYNFDFMTRVTGEIVGKYQVDGVFSNRWAGSGMCYCEHCRKNFHDFAGLDLPRVASPQDPARKQYIVWHQKRLFDLWKVWNDAIVAANPNASFIANSGGGALSDLDMKTLGELSHTLFADRQARHGLMPPWSAGKNAKEYRATLGSKPIGGIVSVGLEEPYRWKDSVQSGEEIKLWMIDGVAQGLRPWFIKFNAKPIDKRWMQPVEDIYVWHHKNEKYLRNVRSLARVAIVYSQQTAHYYGGEQARAKVEDPALGFYEALVEARIPFEMAHDGLLDAAHLAPFRTMILPNIAALSTAQCEQIRQFVSNGGGLVATYQTSMFDEWGVPRADFGFADLFGASSGKLEGPMQNSYLNLEGPHPLLEGFEDATRIINGVNRVVIKPAAQAARAPLTLVPSYPDLPMEEVYTRVSRTGVPGVIAREFGKGRVVYFPWDIDRTFWEVLDVDHGKLLRNAVLWASNERRPVEVAGKGIIDVAVWQQSNSMTVHLVNLTNPMMMKGPIREVIPLADQTVRVVIPEGRRVGGVSLLVSGMKTQVHQEGAILQVEIPRIDLHEVVAIDFTTA